MRRDKTCLLFFCVYKKYHYYQEMSTMKLDTNSHLFEFWKEGGILSLKNS